MTGKEYVDHETQIRKIYHYRFLHHPEGVFGHYIDEFPICAVVERPWLWNKKNKSCLPAGEYDCVLGEFKGYPAYEIIDPSGHRTGVFIHIGNDPMKDSTGCPLPGIGFGKVKQYYGVTSSKAGFDKFMNHMKGVAKFRLIIIDLNNIEKVRSFAVLDMIGIKPRPPKVDSYSTPEAIIKKIEFDPDHPDIKYRVTERIKIAWWYAKPFLAKALKLIGPIVAKVRPALGAAMMLAGEGADRLKSGLTENQKQTVIDQIIRWIIAIINGIKRKGEHGK